ncbi:MoxR family ATPase [Longimicrobium sp.]|uniref:AAA family ATPase n=1 Tax=Longimicrobium sp. TaxID=2029185 RepID=UPI002E3168C0|nr:MoxR family ATPase [Longimicrobium sp.]HEX6040889.1 MoxR family ATPase [Longimicrobium sp.]
MLNAVPASVPEIDLRVLHDLIGQVETVFRGKRETVRLSVAALLARGHLLFEDIPGVGKTTLARALTAALGLEFRRIQFTSDLLPSDVLGVSVYNPRTHEFETRPGPIFTHVVLADEINRAPPRTQSGLLEAMQEGRVTIDERSYELPHPFLVMATQNPLEQHGTYPLPESQLDRFMMRLSIGYPDLDEERNVILQSAGGGDPIARIRPVLDPASVVALQERVDLVHADGSIVDYLMAVVQATRAEPRLRAGASTRGAIALLRAARGYALVDGREFLVPDDVRRLVVPTLAHRLLPAGASAATGEAYEEAVSVAEEILGRIPMPV